jgi:hypothetical protein
VHRATLVLGRGGHALPFRPLGAGEYLVEVEARDLVDHRTRLATTLVTRPRRARG